MMHSGCKSIAIIEAISMVQQIKFTTSKLDKLPVPDAGSIEFADTEITKLRIRVNAGGTKTFFLQKKLNGKTRHTIGVYPDIQPQEARDQAISMLGDAALGIDPATKKAELVKKSATLQAVLDEYIKTHRDLKESTVKDYRYWMKSAFSDWLSKPIASITKDLVAERQAWITDNKGTTTANNCMRILRAVCTYAVATEIIESAPTDILKTARLWTKSKRKNTIIKTEQLPEWYNAVVALPNKKESVYLLTTLYMGFRESEARLLDWTQVDMDSWELTLYDTKNRTDKSFPIPTPLQPFYTELHKQTGRSQWVFPNAKDTAPMSRPNNRLVELDKTLGFHITPHDCRRTFATIAESTSIPLSMIKRLMNHVAGDDITHGYIQTETNTLRKATEQIATVIQSNLGRTADVIPINQYS